MAIIWPIDDILILREKSYRNGHKKPVFRYFVYAIADEPFLRIVIRD